ncbi:electron transport complex subunit E [Methylocaldum sp.]|uniref:electron transport complex subunit E n=1 Tax=Methylocaldum sp. TaxID=1969727 RepID=UPI002D714A77|nr:electron transport complex subunit E [Methylocaldum sp.]HYE37924.1 electron transport complex subunit E [Methylocaldum sp.]
MIDLSKYRKIVRDGLWHNNQAFVALLGLCPLLAVSNSVINSLGLGLATTVALVFSNVIVSLIRNHVASEIRLPVFVLIIASNVTVIELLMNAFFHDLHKILGIFIPLIVTNCAIIGRAEAFASKNPVDRAFVDGLFVGLGFTFALVMLGALREAIGTGAVLNRADLMFGEIAKNWTLPIFSDYDGFLLAILPPGAFIGLGLLIAVKNVIDARAKKKAMSKTAPVQTDSLHKSPVHES